MVRILEEIDVTRPQQLVLLSMAENARDDGTKCFPSVDLIAWKAGYKPRAVIDIMREMRKVGILEVVAEHRAQRATEYRIHLDNAPQKPTFDEWQAAHGRYKERGPYAAREPRETAPLPENETRETAPVQSDEGCSFTSPGVQSHVRGVQSDVFQTRENAPEPVIEPVIEPVNRPSHGLSREREKPKRSTQISENFTITDSLREWGERERFTMEQLQYQVPQFIDHHTSEGTTKKDWDAAFRTWMRNARQWNRLDPRPTVTQMPNGRASPVTSTALRRLEESRRQEGQAG